MSENITATVPNRTIPEEILLRELILKLGRFNKYLISKWKLILSITLIGALAGLIYHKLKKPDFTAECTFVLEDSQRPGGLSQYSGLASMIGIDVGGSSSGLFQDENIAQLYTSRLMIKQTLFSSVKFNGKTRFLIDKYIEINKLREKWNDDIRNINFSIPAKKLTITHDSLINMMVDDINKNYLSVTKPDKKLSLISVTVKSKNQYFSKAFADRIVSNVNSFYIKTRTKNALQNVLLFQRHVDSLGRVLSSSIQATAVASDANPNPNAALQVLKTRSQRHQVDVVALSAMYAEANKNLEIARGALQKETPLIQIIDQPVLPLKSDKHGLFYAVVIGSIMAFLITAFFLFMLKAYRKIMKA